MALQRSLLPGPDPSTEALTPATATGLTSTEIQRLKNSLDQSVSDNTRAMYASAWRSFQTWAQARGSLSLPAAPPLAAAYLAHLAEERHLSVATIRLHRAALAAMHKAGGHEDPTDNEGVKRVLQGISKAHGRSQRPAKPLSAEALAAVKATARLRRPLGAGGKRHESADRASWRDRVDLALLSVLREGLLRRSEAAALTWGDVELRDNGTGQINIRRSKTDPQSRGGNPLHRQARRGGTQGYQARRGTAGQDHTGLRTVAPPDRSESEGRS